MLSHGNLLANIDQGRSTAAQINADDVVYGVLPMFHIFGLNVVLGFSLAERCHGRAGAAVRSVDRPRHDPRTKHHCDPGRATAVAGVQSFRRGARRQLCDRTSRVTGAAKMPEEAIRRLHRSIRDSTGRGLRASPRHLLWSPALRGCRSGSVRWARFSMASRSGSSTRTGDDVLRRRRR